MGATYKPSKVTRWYARVGAILGLSAVAILPTASQSQVYNYPCASAGMIYILNYSTAVIYNSLTGANNIFANKLNAVGNYISNANFGFVAPLGVPYTVGAGRTKGATDQIVYNYSLAKVALGASSDPNFTWSGNSGFGQPFAYFPVMATGNTNQANSSPQTICPPGGSSSASCYVTSFTLNIARPYCANASAVVPVPMGQTDPCAASGQTQQYMLIQTLITLGTQVTTPPKAPPISIFNIVANLGNALQDIAAMATGDPLPAIAGTLQLAGQLGGEWAAAKTNAGAAANNTYFMALNSIRTYATSNPGVLQTAGVSYYANGGYGGNGFSPVYSTLATNADPHVYAVTAGGFGAGGGSIAVNTPASAKTAGSTYSFTIHLSTLANDNGANGGTPAGTGKSCPANYIIALFEDDDYGQCVATGNSGPPPTTPFANCPLSNQSGANVYPSQTNGVSPFGPEGLGIYLSDQRLPSSRPTRGTTP